MKTDRFVAYVTREVIVCRLNGQLLTVTLYERNRPPDQLAVSIPDGIVVESIEVHEAAPGEIPESDRSPSRLTADMIANSPTNMAFTPTY